MSFAHTDVHLGPRVVRTAAGSTLLSPTRERLDFDRGRLKLHIVQRSEAARRYEDKRSIHHRLHNRMEQRGAREQTSEEAR